MQGFRDLIHLHLAVSAERDASREQERLRTEIENIDQRLADAKASLEAEETELERLQGERRKAEGEVELVEQQRSKYREQLMGAKTNEVYRTLLSEIEGAGERISDKETTILELMEESEKAEEKVGTARAALQAREKENVAEAGRMRAEVERLEGERQKAQARTAEVEPSVPANLRTRFHKIAKSRDGKAMALAEDGRCVECHVGIQPQVWVELVTKEDVFSCPGCYRLLYRRENLELAGVPAEAIPGGGAPEAAAPDAAPAESRTAS